jgi:hypothetical protein
MLILVILNAIMLSFVEPNKNLAYYGICMLNLHYESEMLYSTFPRECSSPETFIQASLILVNKVMGSLVGAALVKVRPYPQI